jgi:hypothetical protein
MKMQAIFAVAALLLGSTVALAQSATAVGVAGGGVPAAQATTRDDVSQSNLSNLANLLATKHLMAGHHIPTAVIRSRSEAMLRALHVSCQLREAALIGIGTSAGSKKAQTTDVYEVSCQNGMGYLLSLRDRSKTSAISCFEASTTPPSNSGLRCEFPHDAQLTTMATAVLRHIGVTCRARKIQWLGRSAAPHYDYTDIACTDGTEVVLRTPTPGTAGRISALNCLQALAHGARCRLTSAGIKAAASAAPHKRSGPHPDLLWFEKAFTHYHFLCTVKNARLIGRELVKRRWVAEFQCTQHPRGVVVYVPSAGGLHHKFSHIDCSTAASRHLPCEFPHTL